MNIAEEAADLESWDTEFGFDDDLEDGHLLEEAAPTVIRGITADRVDPDEGDWASDFLFDSDVDSSLPVRAGTKADIFPLKRNSLAFPATPAKKDFIVPERRASAELDISDDDSENWDEEFGFDPGEVSSGLGGLLSAQQQPTQYCETGSLKEKFRLIAGKETVGITRYPKPTRLFTLREKEEHRLFYQETEFEAWLSSLIRSKSPNLYLETTASSEGRDDLKLLSGFHKQITACKKLSKEWIDAYIHFSYRMYLSKYKELCWDAITTAFSELSKVKDWSQIDRPTLATSCLSLLHLAALHWRYDTSYHLKFDEMISIARSIHQPYSYFLDILKVLFVLLITF